MGVQERGLEHGITTQTVVSVATVEEVLNIVFRHAGGFTQQFDAHVPALPRLDRPRCLRVPVLRRTRRAGARSGQHRHTGTRAGFHSGSHHGILRGRGGEPGALCHFLVHDTEHGVNPVVRSARDGRHQRGSIAAAGRQGPLHLDGPVVAAGDGHFPAC